MTVGEAIDHVLARVNDLSLGGAPECYAVSEAVWRLAGGRASGLDVMRVKVQREDKQSHWFLRGPFGEIIDLTAGQFDDVWPVYANAKRAAFYPQTSRLARELMS